MKCDRAQQTVSTNGLAAVEKNNSNEKKEKKSLTLPFHHNFYDILKWLRKTWSGHSMAVLTENKQSGLRIKSSGSRSRTAVKRFIF